MKKLLYILALLVLSISCKKVQDDKVEFVEYRDRFCGTFEGTCHKSSNEPAHNDTTFNVSFVITKYLENDSVLELTSNTHVSHVKINGSGYGAYNSGPPSPGSGNTSYSYSITYIGNNSIQYLTTTRDSWMKLEINYSLHRVQ